MILSGSGNLTVSGTSTIANGTAAAPSLVFAGSTTTGLYRYGANVVGLAMNGLHGFAFNGAGEMYGPGVNGYVSLPSAGGVSLTAGGTN
ncbi:hypothetical protein, partial [Escherichia coli]|uniref:hypothetical protein n=1 Tax=Escherichia coli TaxID=562 RepID=UPI00200D6129